MKACIDLDHLAKTVALHINNAQASIAAGGGFILDGFASAISAWALSDEVLLYLDERDGNYSRFENFRRQASEVSRAYRDKYVLATTIQQNPESIKPTVTIRHINGPHRGGRKKITLSRQQQQKLAELLAGGTPDGTSMTAWRGLLAEEFGISISTIQRMERRLRVENEAHAG